MNVYFAARSSGAVGACVIEAGFALLEAQEDLARNNITLDLPTIPQPETCVYDIEDSCTNNYP